ncbi:MAG: hypothetical protein ACR2RB_15010 [Gammaproteobacteria bacterium]
MHSAQDGSPRWSVHRSFVLQFDAEADVASGRATGRVEHVASGETTRFGSLAQLLDFVAQVLADVADKGTAGDDTTDPDIVEERS